MKKNDLTKLSVIGSASETSELSKLQENRGHPERVKTMLGYAMIGLPQTYTGVLDNIGVAAVLDQSDSLDDSNACFFRRGDA
jgi:hypothetical protein